MNDIGKTIFNLWKTTQSMKPVLDFIQEYIDLASYQIKEEIFKIPLEEWTNVTGITKEYLPYEFARTKLRNGQLFLLLTDGFIHVYHDETLDRYFVMILYEE